MNLKDEIKTALVTLTAAFTLGGCIDKKEAMHQTEDMLTAKYNDDVDLYGNAVRLQKKQYISVYNDREMTKKDYQLLRWVLDNNKEVDRKRSGEKTHGEEFVLPNGDSGFVEVYDDGVLKENNSLILINKEFTVIGEGKNYEYNLNRRAEEIQKEHEKQAKIRRLEQIRAQERAEARRRANRQKESADTIKVFEAADSIAPEDTTKHEVVRNNKQDSLHTDSVKHVVKHIKMSEYE